MPGMQSVGELLSAARGFEARLGRLEPPAALGERASPRAAREALRNIERRLVEGPSAPVRVALFGPTGSGKSKLFNSLIGENLSPASYLRPFTRRPMYYLHQDRASIRGSLRGEVRLHRREGWEDLVLIDAPDFDSVEAENRAQAAHIYLEADAFILVVDIHKYADASVWSYLERIRAEGKRCLFVLNKVARPGKPPPSGPREDFRERLGKVFAPAGPPGPLLEVAASPQGDEDLLPESALGLGELQSALHRYHMPDPDARRALLAESLRIDLTRFLTSWDSFTGPLVEYRSGLRKLSRDFEARLERAKEALSRDLQARVDPALKSEVYREVLRRIERIDVLRFPRRLLALPVLGLKRALGRFWPALSGSSGETDPGGREASEAANLSALEERVLDLSEETREAMRGEPACPGLLDDAAYRELRIDHREIRERYRRTAEEFRAWAQAEARRAAAALTAEHKVKFVLSQLIYNTVVIGVQVKTAGTLTLTQMLTDGILSPLVAKAVGMALSSERVRQFEEEAQREHARRLWQVLKEAGERFARYLAEREAGLQEIEAMAPEVEKLRSSASLVERWARGER